MIQAEYYMVIIKKEEGFTDTLAGVTDTQPHYPTDTEIEEAIRNFEGTHAMVEKQHKLVGEQQ